MQAVGNMCRHHGPRYLKFAGARTTWPARSRPTSGARARAWVHACGTPPGTGAVDRRRGSPVRRAGRGCAATPLPSCVLRAGIARTCAAHRPARAAVGADALPARRPVLPARACICAGHGQVKMGAHRRRRLCGAAQGRGSNSGPLLCPQPWLPRALFCDGPHQGVRPAPSAHFFPLGPALLAPICPSLTPSRTGPLAPSGGPVPCPPPPAAAILVCAPGLFCV